jgi:hypothetical protein
MMLVVLVIVDVRDIVSAIDDVHIARGRRRDRSCLHSFEEEHGADECTEDEEEDRAPSRTTTPPCTTISSSSWTFHCRHGASCLRHYLYSFVIWFMVFPNRQFYAHYRMHYLNQSHMQHSNLLICLYRDRADRRFSLARIINRLGAVSNTAAPSSLSQNTK